MSTSKKTASTKSHATSDVTVVPPIAVAPAPEPAVAPRVPEHVAVPATVAAPPTAVPPAMVAAAAASAPNIVLVPLPPADAKIPSTPDGFVATNAIDYRGVTPKKAELAVLPKALEELARFVTYTATFGKTAPPIETVRATLTAALAWSLMRNATDEWDLYARTMEGLAWTDARPLMEMLHDAFTAAGATDASVKTLNPSTVSLLNAATAIAQRGAETRKANARSVAKGEAPVKGKAAAKAKKEAKIVADAAAKAAAKAAAAPPTPEPAAPPAPTANTAQQPAATTPPLGTNGAAH